MFTHYDFTTSAGQALGGVSAQKAVNTGVWAIIAGDVNSDGIIDLTDELTIWETEAGFSGYLNGDAGMDAETNNKDKDDLWKPNLNRQSYIPE